MDKLSYPRLTQNIGQINSASFLTLEEEEFVVSGSNVNQLFNSTKNSIEVSVYDVSTDELLSWGVVSSSVTSNTSYVIYTDLNGDSIYYSYTINKTEYSVIRGDKQKRLGVSNEILLDPTVDISYLNLPNASYKMVYTLVSNEVGNKDDMLKIVSVSPSRTEIKATLNKPSETTETQLKSFSENKPLGEEVIPDIINGIERFKIQESYYFHKDRNVEDSNALKFYYSLKTDVDVINFLNKIFSTAGDRFTIYYQFQNYLYSKYNSVISFDEILNEYENISDVVIRNQLNRISTIQPKEYSNIISFIKMIFNDVFVIPVNTAIENFSRFRNKFLNTFLNSGDNSFHMILNWKSDVSDENSIFIKLKDPLPDGIENFYISRIVRDPAVIKVSLYSIVEQELNHLRPANFSINKTSTETKTFSNDSLTNGRYNDINIETSKNSSIQPDYRYFENFVMFSSAKTRLDNYISKSESIDEIQNLIDSYPTSSLDSYQTLELSNLRSQINNIKLNFDGYERFLDSSPEWLSIHSEITDGGISSASYYDRFNQYSLRNNLADYIVEDTNNVEFVSFCDSVGQVFDEIFSHVNLMTKNKKVSNDSINGISDDIVNRMLSTLGWGASGNEDEDLFVSLFGQNASGDRLDDISAKQRRNIIWRRLLNNLPYILKTKGTLECIRAMFNVYGIPPSLYTIKEFSSVPNNEDNKNLYIFDNDYYAVHFSGSNEYFESEWSENVNTVEFKFSFDADKINSDGDIFRLVGLGDNWVIGSIRDKSDNRMGRMFFTLAAQPSDMSSIKTIVTDLIPIFDGNVYTVMLRKNGISDNIIFEQVRTECGTKDVTLTEDEIDWIPTKYDLIVKRSTDDRISTSTSASYFFSESYNRSFSGKISSSISSSNLLIGNFSQIASTITPDPNAFHGTIDQFKLYKNSLSDDRFDSHVFYVDAYDIGDVNSLSDNLLLHLKFNKPVDLFSGSSAEALSNGYVTISNEAFNTSSISNIKAYNFPDLSTESEVDICKECCDHLPKAFEIISSSFPWHFKRFQSIEHVKVPNFGGSSFKNNRIFYDQSYFSGSLYKDVKSNNNIDRSLDIANVSIGIFFSPTEEENREILKFFGDFNVGDLIGDPKLIYEKQYKAFNRFKKVFYDEFKGKNFHDYINLIRHYVDKSVFTNIEKLIPARSKLKSGILIEPSILERNKLEYKEIDVSVYSLEESLNAYSDVNATPFFGVTKDGSINYTDEINVDTGENSSRYANLNKSYYPDILDPEFFSIYSDNGIVWFGNKRYLAEKYTEKQVISDFKRTISENEDNFWSHEIEVERLNLIDITSEVSSSPDNIRSYYSANMPHESSGSFLNGYYRLHRKNNRRLFKSISTQDEDSTISIETGLLNGSSPVEISGVDRGVINVETEGEGIILEGDS